jgi:hypothetical protein
MFKTNELMSIDPADIFKIMTSSGTTSQAVSRVFLDRDTAELQSRALTSIMTTLLGQTRLPMLIVDTPNVVKDRTMFSARGAGVLGMLPFGRKHFYALNDDMELDIGGTKRFLKAHDGTPILIFGFTFMVWKYLLQSLASRGIDIDLSQATLIHSGGWKKLQDEAVGNSEFRAVFEQVTGLTRVHNFYGMVEQVGSVFVEGDDGYLHCPNFSEVIVRDPDTWLPAPVGHPGVIQVFSVLPRSYPGHSLLTEDLGVVHHPDPSQAWKGTRFEVLGRIPRSELRGCSDTHASEVLTNEH